MKPVDKLAVALDVPTLEQARKLAGTLAGRVGVFKVGLELFVAHGPEAVEAARSGGQQVFLDLKVHDIPRTAAAAIRSAGRLGARFVTLHALGGPAMIAAAREAAEEFGEERPQLLAVTVLTSHDSEELARIGLADDPAKEVPRLARMALDAGADGLVASAREARTLRDLAGPRAHLVTPGIRPAGSASGDQKRVATPSDAIRDGASLLVIGRPIVEADDPGAAADAILEEMARAGSES